MAGDPDVSETDSIVLIATMIATCSESCLAPIQRAGTRLPAAYSPMHHSAQRIGRVERIGRVSRSTFQQADKIQGTAGTGRLRRARL
jgi:hypothetical protein